MKTIELLNSIYNGNAELDEDVKLIEDYTRLQIEKDRERVKRQLDCGITSVEIAVIDTTPITLD